MKLSIQVNVFNDSVAWNDYKIDDFLNLITVAKSKGATNVEFETEENYGSCSCTMTCYYFREETDEEYTNRLELEAERQKEQRQRELLQLEWLQKKYGQGKPPLTAREKINREKNKKK